MWCLIADIPYNEDDDVYDINGGGDDEHKGKMNIFLCDFERRMTKWLKLQIIKETIIYLPQLNECCRFVCYLVTSMIEAYFQVHSASQLKNRICEIEIMCKCKEDLIKSGSTFSSFIFT